MTLEGLDDVVAFLPHLEVRQREKESSRSGMVPSLQAHSTWSSRQEHRLNPTCRSGAPPAETNHLFSDHEPIVSWSPTLFKLLNSVMTSFASPSLVMSLMRDKNTLSTPNHGQYRFAIHRQTTLTVKPARKR